MTVSAHGRPLDPRVERSRLVIRQAALVELGEVGYGNFTIESVAARAGVGKSTIYRHWRSKLALIADAFESLNLQPRPTLTSGSARQRVALVLRHVADVMRDSLFSRCVPALIEASQQHPEVAEFFHRYNAQRRQTLIDVIADGVANGEFPAHVDPEVAGLALVGPIFYRRLMTTDAFDPERVGDIIINVLGPDPGQSLGGMTSGLAPRPDNAPRRASHPAGAS